MGKFLDGKLVEIFEVLVGVEDKYKLFELKFFVSVDLIEMFFCSD